MILLIILIALMWLLFREYGEEGWYSIIPFYGKYVLYTLEAGPQFFWGWLGCTVFFVGFANMGQLFLAIIFAIASIACTSLALAPVLKKAYEIKVKIYVIVIWILDIFMMF